MIWVIRSASAYLEPHSSSDPSGLCRRHPSARGRPSGSGANTYYLQWTNGFRSISLSPAHTSLILSTCIFLESKSSRTGRILQATSRQQRGLSRIGMICVLKQSSDSTICRHLELTALSQLINVLEGSCLKGVQLQLGPCERFPR